jgi:hypothetical protein
VWCGIWAGPVDARMSGAFSIDGAFGQIVLAFTSRTVSGWRHIACVLKFHHTCFAVWIELMPRLCFAIHETVVACAAGAIEDVL